MSKGESISGKRHRIVILGGGFGGVYTAIHLERLCKRRTDVEICLVNNENYLVFQPMLAEVVSGNIGILDPVTPIRRLAPRTRLYVRHIERVDLQKQVVTLAAGFSPQPTPLAYDHLVLALGNVTDFHQSPGLRDHALPFKYLSDALRIRDRVIHALSEASHESDVELRKQLLTFVIGGGGFSGVEVCAELNDFVRQTAHRYFGLNRDEVRVILVHSHDRILNREMPKSLALYAQKVLTRRGVEFVFNRRIESATPDCALLDDGTRLWTKTLISTVPSSPNPLLETLDVPSEHGRLVADRFMQVNGYSNVWALGDCAAIPLAKGTGDCPPTAQFAVRQATVCAANIVATLDGTPRREFAFSELGKLAALGGRKAIAQLFGRINLHGFTAWVFWRSVYWAKLPGLDRKIRVAVFWMLDLLLPPDLVQTGLSRPRGIAEEHYESGDFVFREGGYGKQAYIVVAGRAEVTHVTAGGVEDTIGQLEPGDCFAASEVLDDSPHLVSVRCTTSLRVLVIPKEELGPLAEALPHLRDRFDTFMATLASHRDAIDEAEPGSLSANDAS